MDAGMGWPNGAIQDGNDKILRLLTPPKWLYERVDGPTAKDGGPTPPGISGEEKTPS